MMNDHGSTAQAEDDGMKAMSSCATSKSALLASAKALTANSAGLDSAKTKARLVDHKSSDYAATEILYQNRDYTVSGWMDNYMRDQAM